MDSLMHWILHDGYVGLFIALSLEMIGAPFPAETILTLMGIGWSKGEFTFWGLWIAAVLGNICGSGMAYGIGYYAGRPLLFKYGKKVGLTSTRLDKVETKLNQQPILFILIGKFISIVRVLVPYISGIHRISFVTFFLFNFMSACIWVTIFLWEGKYIGVLWPFLHHYIQNKFEMGLFVLFIIMIFTFLLKKGINQFIK